MLRDFYEKGDAQMVTRKTGNNLQGEGYAHLKGRAMPKTYHSGTSSFCEQFTGSGRACSDKILLYDNGTRTVYIFHP